MPRPRLILHHLVVRDSMIDNYCLDLPNFRALCHALAHDSTIGPSYRASCSTDARLPPLSSSGLADWLTRCSCHCALRRTCRRRPSRHPLRCPARLPLGIVAPWAATRTCCPFATRCRPRASPPARCASEPCDNLAGLALDHDGHLSRGGEDNLRVNLLHSTRALLLHVGKPRLDMALLLRSAHPDARNCCGLDQGVVNPGESDAVRRAAPRKIGSTCRRWRGRCQTTTGSRCRPPPRSSAGPPVTTHP